MVNISRIISTLGRLEGSSARMTLSGKQVLQLMEKKEGTPTAVSDVIAGLVQKHPGLKADVAYKASEQGFTVGAMTLRDGKEVVGRGAASITGLGTEEAVLKVRLSAGKNGEILQMSGYHNYAHPPRIQDCEISTSIKGGVLESSNKAGEFGASRTRLDIPKAIEAAGLKEEAAVAIKKGNNFLDRLWGQFRDLLAGKEVELTPPINKTAFKMKAAKAKDVNFDKIKTAVKKDYSIPKNCYKMPNGTTVPKEEFEKHIEEYFKSTSSLVQNALKNGREDIANTQITELKNLANQIKEQTGYEVKCDWTKYLGDAFKI